MQREITRGASANAGLIFHVFAQDSTSTVGAGKTGLAYSAFSCRYVRNGETISGAITAQDITTLGTYQAPTANTNIRIKLVDDTNMPGIYEVHLHSDWVNTTNSCQSLTIYLSASGAAVLPIQIPLVGWNPQDGVRGGMTALPNAAAGGNGGLPTVNASNQVAGVSGDVAGKVLGGGASSITGTGVRADDRDGAAIAKLSLLPAALVGGRMDCSVGAMAANVITSTAFNAGAIASGKIGAGAITATEAPNLDAAMTSRAPASTALSNATWTDVKAGYIDAAISTRASSASLATHDGNLTTHDGLEAARFAALNDLSGAEIQTAVFAYVLENSKTFAELLRRLFAAEFGKTSGMNTAAGKCRNLADDKDRIQATLDGAGNRTAMAFDDT